MTLKIFIERPVLSTVISVILVILGILGLVALPITQYPEIAPPTVQVSASYPGANADVVLNSVIVPLEEQINGVENMTYMTSSAGNDGSGSITIFFKQGTNPDLDAVNVQNRVSRATPLLPAEVTRAGVTTSKRQSSMVMVFSINSTNKSFDGTFLQNYANINVLPMLKRVNGVGDVTAFGTQDYSMRIWLKPDAMAAYGLIPDDINTALAEQNVEAAPGKIGENSNQSFQYVLKYKGRLRKPAEYENIIIKATSTGQLLRLKDVARIELGSLDYSVTSTTDNHPSIVCAVFQAAGSNAHAMIKECEKTIATASKSFPPGVTSNMIFTANQFLDVSINKVVETLIEAFILVSIVVFVFLQDLRSTLIPAIAVPVAIVGTFFFLQLFGFTINLLTLFALVLAIGIVVDDAIVVVEAVHAKLDQHVPTAREATLEAMSEISGAVVSITLVMAAVFIPVTFITGSVGVFYKQFGLTLAVAILISAVNALTLSPALCALLLKPHGENKLRKKGFLQRFYWAFNVSFAATTQKYKRAVQFLSRKRWIAVTAVLLFIALFAYLLKVTPAGFVPNEDQSFIMADVSLPPASSLERTTRITDHVVDVARHQPEMNSVVRIAGSGIMSGGNGGSYGSLFMNLKSWDQRKGDQHSVDAVINNLFGATADIKGARVFFIAPPTLEGFGNSSGFEFQVQDRSGGDIAHFYDVNSKFLAALNKRPEIQYATSFFNINFPQYEVEVNVAKCKEANLSPATVLSTMQGYYGSIYASNFNEFGKQYRVMIQADAAYRSDVQSLDKVFVRTGNNVMAPVTEFVSLKRVYGPEFINRFNLFTSIAVSGAPKPGYSSGDAIKAIQEVAAKTLPVGYGYEFSGLSREELSSGNQTVLIFVLCLVFVYFLLSAQYESYILPFAVILSLSIGLAGAFIFANLFGVQNNIYLQITLIMLIGLLAKNAILIVEFALARRRAGENMAQAALDGAVARLRPILMTSFAFIFGIMPLMVSSGAGAAGNRSIGTGAVGGMLIGTVFGVFVIPVLFIVFQTIQERISRKPRPVAAVLPVMLVVLASLSFGSCVTQKYQAPGMPVKGDLYRGASRDSAGARNLAGDTTLAGDTASMAVLPYRALFADTLLQGLIDEGLRENPDLKVAMERMTEARENFLQSKLAYLPDLSANANATRSKQSAAALNLPPAYIGTFPLTTTSYQASLSTSWEADIWGKFRSGKRGALAAFLQSDAARRVIETQLIADIAGYYYQLLSFDEQLRITQQTVRNRQEDVTTIKALMENGLATGAAVVQSDANRVSAELLVPDLSQSILETENALSILLGRVPGEIKRGLLAAQAPYANLQAGVPSQLMRNRPDVQQAELAFRVAFENVNVAQTYFYPQLTITAQGGLSTLQIKNFFDHSVFYNLVGGLTQPIFTKRQNTTRLHVAQAQQREAFYAYQKTLLTAGAEVSNSFSSYKTALDKQRQRVDQVRLLEQAVDFTKELLKYSSATNYTDVLTSEQSLLAAQLSGVNDRLQQLQAIVNLYKALGGGWR
ncbi:efflux RND transporter permease subunit [Puia sp.]|jgi:HAE1 family hydrophobic/amphiphilic exporter-1|uniref:efflux RND transporter permease subunit n=1 Tax=Puia sp. TaxID=2045100 RepID=UPI002F3E3A5E